jgi:hypothetical protein
MSSTVIPFRPRAPSARDASYNVVGSMRRRRAPRSTSVRIDGSVSLYQLLSGLQSVGLSFRREPGSGVYVISPRPAPRRRL